MVILVIVNKSVQSKKYVKLEENKVNDKVDKSAKIVYKKIVLR